MNKASTNQEESRYSQRTLGDIRDNLTGTRKIFEVFRDGLKKKTNAADETRDGPTIDDHIEAGFDRLQALYAETEGEALPAPPPTWSAENPSPTDLDGPFGRLYAGVRAAVDPEAPDSIVVQMKHAAALLGLTRP